VIDDPDFSLALEATWQRLYPDDRRQYTWHDDQKDLTLILSAGSHDISFGQIDQASRLVLDLLLHSETTIATVLGRTATIYEPVIVPRPWGRAIAYYGHDGAGRQFGHSAILTCRCRISAGLWSSRRSEAELLAAMDDIASRIVFDRTPLDQERPFR